MRRLIALAAVSALAILMVSADKDGKPETVRSPWSLNEVCQVNDTLSWGVGDDGVVAKKTAGTWVLETGLVARLGGLACSDFTGVFFWDERHGWIVGNKKTDGTEGRERGAIVLRTTDGGKNWELTHPFVLEGSRLLKVSFGSCHYGWITTDSEWRLLTKDGGATWAPTSGGGEGGSLHRARSAEVRE